MKTTHVSMAPGFSHSRPFLTIACTEIVSASKLGAGTERVCGSYAWCVRSRFFSAELQPLVVITDHFRQGPYKYAS
jgi:hypothetical protein